MATRIKNVDEIINSSGTVTLKIDEAATTADLTQMKNDILGVQLQLTTHCRKLRHTSLRTILMLDHC